QKTKPTALSLFKFSPPPPSVPPPMGEVKFSPGKNPATTDGTCNASFLAKFPGSVPAGYVITATATDPANNTSEFSTCLPVSPAPLLSIAALISQQVRLSWPVTSPGFALKQTTNLTPPIVWSPVTNSVITTNSQFTVTVPSSTT